MSCYIIYYVISYNVLQSIQSIFTAFKTQIESIYELLIEVLGPLMYVYIGVLCLSSIVVKSAEYLFISAYLLFSK